MRYFGIKTAGKYQIGGDSYIWWITNSEHDSWMAFFTWPDKDGNKKYHRPPVCEAIEAYKALGYRCVELELVEKKIVDDECEFE